jgi:hypothetical protein
MPDIPGRDWYKHSPKLVEIPKPSVPAQQLRLQVQRLERVKDQLEDLQTQLSTLAGVVDTVMDKLYDIQVKLEDK